jgi:SAM-dependent methyltransferase
VSAPAAPLEFLALKDISESYLEIVNPISREKLLALGDVLDLRQDAGVIDFGCGYGEALMLWAEHYGVRGVGVDIRRHACARAERKLATRGLGERIEIFCEDAAAFQFPRHGFDVAVCIGATFIWHGFRQTLWALKAAVREAGKIVVGEPHWRSAAVPPEFARAQPSVHTEYELLHIAREEDLDLEYVVRASHDDWDAYEAANWRGLLAWLQEHPEHPHRAQVIGHLYQSQDEYTRFGREHLGWAVYVLRPRQY